MADSTAAAIRRASQQARNAMQALDMRAMAELDHLYETAADQVRASVRAQAEGDGSVSAQRLRALLQQIDDIMDTLHAQRGQLLQGAMGQAAELGVRPFTAAGLGATGRTVPAVLEAASAFRISQEAVRAVQAFTAADGLKLSDRVWALTSGAKEVLRRQISQAVVSGWDAAKAAQQLVMEGQPVPLDLQQRMAGAQASAVVSAADVLTDSDGEYFKAERVLRTEINRAHGTAYMASAVEAPGFAGFRFLLSPAHPRPDICDLLARQNLHGLGEGVYPDAESCPWPAHPNTLSFVVVVFESEISQADRDGKETPLQALGRMAPELRRGVLGPTKAEYFDKGLLTQAMIRANVSAVDERLARQSLAPAGG